MSATEVFPPATAATAPTLTLDLADAGADPACPTRTRTRQDSRAHEPDDAAREVHARVKESWTKEASCHAAMLIAGWSDASSGPLLPYIQDYYDVSYTVVSMLFVGQAVGFLASAGATYFLTRRFGLGKAIVFGAALQAFAYALLIPAFPFPLFPVLYAVSGFGMSIQDALANVYVASLDGSEAKLGYLHASYGIGAALCPLAATAFASHFPRTFTHFWAISLGIACLNVLILLLAFRFNYVMDDSEHSSTQAKEATPVPSSPREETQLEAQPSTTCRDASSVKSLDASRPHTTYPPSLQTDGLRKVQAAQAGSSVLKEALLNRTTLVSCAFILFYVGSEVSMGGWIVTFLIDSRNGGPDAGYVATGFWLGLALGRAVLNPVNRWVGEKRVVYFYLALALSLEFAIWFADSLVGNAVVVAIIGFLIAPIYPIVMSLVTKILPRKFHGPSIAGIASFGQTGSAVFPFLIGALSQKFSPKVLQPVMVVLFGVQFALWFLLPNVARKKE
ncbi:hypothetical protein JCM10212_001305 [Sporobolomyces blumeae]